MIISISSSLKFSLNQVVAVKADKNAWFLGKVKKVNPDSIVVKYLDGDVAEYDSTQFSEIRKIIKTEKLHDGAYKTAEIDKIAGRTKVDEVYQEIFKIRQSNNYLSKYLNLIKVVMEKPTSEGVKITRTTKGFTVVVDPKEEILDLTFLNQYVEALYKGGYFKKFTPILLRLARLETFFTGVQANAYKDFVNAGKNDNDVAVAREKLDIASLRGYFLYKYTKQKFYKTPPADLKKPASKAMLELESLNVN